MIGKVHGGGMTGIPSNVGNIKAYCIKTEIELSKGMKAIPLNLPFDMERIIAGVVSYGGYLSGQPMMDFNGNYSNDYGIAFRINYNTKTLDIFASSSYTKRFLNLIIFYV